MKKKTDKETLDLYKSMLPHGAQVEIAQRLGVSKAFVNMYLNGRCNGDHIEDAVLDYIAEYKEKKNERLRKAGLL